MNNDEFYQQAAREIAEDRVQQGLMAKACALTDGDQERTRAFYMRLRAEELQQDALAAARKRIEQLQAELSAAVCSREQLAQSRVKQLLEESGAAAREKRSGRIHVIIVLFLLTAFVIAIAIARK
jgi:hypothetical protein